jgi:hypothetical protein
LSDSCFKTVEEHTMDILAFVALIITGFTSCAEFGSYAFVHPVIRLLPHEHHIGVEQGLLKTFGRVMPVMMTLCVILSLSYAISLNSIETAAISFVGHRRLRSLLLWCRQSSSMCR